jgi:hypothetical protein
VQTRADFVGNIVARVGNYGVGPKTAILKQVRDDDDGCAMRAAR